MFAALADESDGEKPVPKAETQKQTAERGASASSEHDHDEAAFTVKQGKQKKKRPKGRVGAPTVRCVPGSPGFAEELMVSVSRSIQVALMPLKPHIASTILEFIGPQDPLQGHRVPLAFRTVTHANNVEDRWQAELQLRGPLKFFYEAVQSGSVKTKSSYRQNADIYQLEGFWRRGVATLHLHWTKEIRRFHDGATQLTSETSREVQKETQLRCGEHGCGSVFLQGSLQPGRSADTFWLCRKGISCHCGFPCCCTCGAGRA